MGNRRGLLASSMLTCIVGIFFFAGPALAVSNVGDRVWMDLNGDGIQNCEDVNNNGVIGDEGDTGEECLTAGIPGVTVDLMDCADSNKVLASTQTDASGFYSFERITPGEYCVRFELDTVPDKVCAFGPPEFTTQDAGSDEAVDSDADPTTGVTASVKLVAGQTNLALDAGIRCSAGPASLGDRVWMDLNGDGIQNCEDANNNGIIGDEGDTGEECLAAGISGVTVDLVDCADSNTVLASTQTDASGFYLFDDLSPGKYCVRFEPETIPDSMCDYESPEFTTQNAGSDDASDSDADPITGVAAAVTLAEGETNLTVDAGVVCPQPSPPCKFIVKRVSVDGGATYVDADQCTDELLAEDFGAIYEICVTNCEDKTLDLVKVSDPKLNFYKHIYKMKPGDQQCFVIDRPNICDDRDGRCPYWHNNDKDSRHQKFTYWDTSSKNLGCNDRCPSGCHHHDTCDEKEEIINEAYAKGYVKWCFLKYRLVVEDKDTACVVCKHKPHWHFGSSK